MNATRRMTALARYLVSGGSLGLAVVLPCSLLHCLYHESLAAEVRNP
jgi:hypothetical protein